VPSNKKKKTRGRKRDGGVSMSESARALFHGNVRTFAEEERKERKKIVRKREKGAYCVCVCVCLRSFCCQINSLYCFQRLPYLLHPVTLSMQKTPKFMHGYKTRPFFIHFCFIEQTFGFAIDKRKEQKKNNRKVFKK